MSLPTTLDALKTELEAIDGVVEVITGDPRTNTGYSFPAITVKYLFTKGDITDEHSSVVFEKPDDTILYYKKIPDALQEIDQRDFYLTEEQVWDRIEEDDLTIDIIDLTLRFRGDFDQASVEYVKDDKIDSNTYLIRKDEVSEWTQPSGKEDAYDTDDVVEHNNLLWRSLIKENETEPIEGSDWTEITEEELVHINPRNKE